MTFNFKMLYVLGTKPSNWKSEEKIDNIKITSGHVDIGIIRYRL